MYPFRSFLGIKGVKGGTAHQSIIYVPSCEAEIRVIYQAERYIRLRDDYYKAEVVVSKKSINIPPQGTIYPDSFAGKKNNSQDQQETW